MYIEVVLLRTKPRDPKLQLHILSLQQLKIVKMNYFFYHCENGEMEMYVMICEPRLIYYFVLYRHLRIRAGTKKA